MADAKRLVEFSMVPSLAREISSQINSSSQRSPGYGITLIGDSRMRQQFLDGTDSIATPYPANGAIVKTAHFINWASALSGGSLTTRGNYGASGKRSDEYLVNLSAALATGAAIIGILGIVNDGSAGSTASAMFSRIRDAAVTVLNAGETPLLFTDPGATNFSASQIASLIQYNEMLIEWAEKTPGVLLFDLASIVWDQSSGSFTFKSGYSEDGVHFTPLGNYWIGKALAAYLAPILKAYPRVSGSSIFNPTNGNIGQLTNGLFLTTTGGTAEGGMSGSIPASFIAGTQGTTTGVSSVATAPDGFGNAVMFDLNSGGVGDGVYLNSGTNLSNYTAGDIVDSSVRILINAGAERLSMASLNTNFGGEPNPTSDLRVNDGYNAALPSDLNGKVLTLRSVPYTIKAGASWAFFSTLFRRAASGNVNVTIWNPMMRRRYSR